MKKIVAHNTRTGLFNEKVFCDVLTSIDEDGNCKIDVYFYTKTDKSDKMLVHSEYYKSNCKENPVYIGYDYDALINEVSKFVPFFLSDVTHDFNQTNDKLRYMSHNETFNDYLIHAEYDKLCCSGRGFAKKANTDDSFTCLCLIKGLDADSNPIQTIISSTIDNLKNLDILLLMSSNKEG